MFFFLLVFFVVVVIIISHFPKHIFFLFCEIIKQLLNDIIHNDQGLSITKKYIKSSKRFVCYSPKSSEAGLLYFRILF